MKPYQVTFIVKLLAYFDEVDAAADIFHETYGIEIHPDAILQCNPESKTCKLNKAAQEFFYETQQRILDGAVVLPVLNKLWRVMKYQQLAEHFQSTGRSDLLVKVLELVEVEGRPIYEHLNKAIGLENTLNKKSQDVN